MEIKEQRITLISAGAFSLISIIAFWLVYISLYTAWGAPLITVYNYFSRFFEILIPPIAALLMLITLSEKGLGAATVRALIYAACSVFYELPSSAFEFAYGGYEIFDVIMLSLLYTLLEAVSLFITYMLLFLIMLFVMKLFVKRTDGTDLDIKKELFQGSVFDFSSSLTIASLSACGIVFLAGLVLEISETVEFLTLYSENYTLRELLSIMLGYIFILGMFLLSHATVFFVRKLLLRRE